VKVLLSNLSIGYR